MSARLSRELELEIRPELATSHEIIFTQRRSYRRDKFRLLNVACLHQLLGANYLSVFVRNARVRVPVVH